MNNIEELKNYNTMFISEHGDFTESDFKMIEENTKLIEETRNKTKVMIGDIVKYTNPYGEYYANAIVEKNYNDEEYTICESPYIPFICGVKENKKDLLLSISGGAFKTIDKSKFKYVGQDKRLFCDWGHCRSLCKWSNIFYVYS